MLKTSLHVTISLYETRGAIALRKCLIVVDMQRDFIDGALGFEQAFDVIEPIKEKILIAREEGIEVIFTQDTHHENYLNTEEGKNLPVEHCVEGHVGHEIYPEIQPLIRTSDKIFKKPTFPSLELGNYLKNQAFEEVELCGLVSNICVLSNAVIVKAALDNAHIIVDQNATRSFDESLHEASLDVMEGLHIEIKNRS